MWRDNHGDASGLDQGRQAVEEEERFGQAADEVGGQDGVKLGQVVGKVAGIPLKDRAGWVGGEGRGQ